jgi:RNA polymerase sigma-32 factor
MATELALKKNTLPSLNGAKTALNALAPINDLDNYIRFAHQVPMLEKAEEIQLAKDLHEKGDLKAAQKLILSHLRFVIKIARDLNGYGLAQADLIQEGTVGLMKAVKRFDPTQGVRLVTFAVHWVKAEMHEFIIKNWRIVKVATTKAQRKLFFKLRSAKKRLGWCTKEEIDVVSKELNVSKEEILTMEQRMSAIDATNSSYEEYDPLESLSYGETHNPASIVLEHNQQDQEVDALKTALNTLDQRAKEILQLRWLTDKKATLTELAKKYNVSAERIRQLEKEAMKKLKIKLVTAA